MSLSLTFSYENIINATISCPPTDSTSLTPFVPSLFQTFLPPLLLYLLYLQITTPSRPVPGLFNSQIWIRFLSYCTSNVWILIDRIVYTIRSDPIRYFFWDSLGGSSSALFLFEHAIRYRLLLAWKSTFLNMFHCITICRSSIGKNRVKFLLISLHSVWIQTWILQFQRHNIIEYRTTTTNYS